MALQVWLPLNGTLENNGLSKNTTVTNNGATVGSDGKIGSCYSFDGTNDYMEFSNLNIDSKRQLTIAFWCRANVSDSTTGIFTVRNSGGSHQISLYNSRLYFRDSNHSTLTGIQFEQPTQNVWTHYVIVYDNGSWIFYKNGLQINRQTYSSATLNSGLSEIRIGRYQTSSGNAYYNGKLNDFRIYDHALSQKEISELSQALILHYSLSEMEDHNTSYDSVGENLFLCSRMTESDVDNLVPPSSTDWTKHIRYYNGTTSNYFFGGEYVRECTVTLNAAQNLGICFVRSASEMNLDPSSNYTISCEAKCSNKNRTLCIGLSYMNTSNTWTWRGGTNPKTFTENGTWQTFTHTFKPDSDTKYICYCFTEKGTANSTDTFTIRKCKLEKGSTNTGYAPAPQDIVQLDTPYNTSSVADLSGYGRTGTPTADLTFNTDTARYTDSTEFNGSKYIQLTSPSTEVRTIAFWARWNTIPSGSGQSVVFVDQKSKMGFGLMNTGILCSSNGVLTYTFPKTSIVANQWYHFAIVNTSSTPTATTRDLYINGAKQTPTSSTSYWTFASSLDYLQVGKRSTTSDGFAGKLSDFRMYSTALSASDILDLYNAPVYIDNLGTMGAFEFVENSENGQSIEKTGIVGVKNLIEYSDNLKLMSDGGVFLKLLRHNNPASKLFTENNCWLNTIDPDLYSSLVVLKTVEWMRNLNTYEFLACEKLTSNGTENQYCWKQSNNPATTSLANGFQLVSGTAQYLTAGLANAGTHGCFDINGANWWCCCGCYEAYQGGIPGFNGVVTTGYIELYIRIPDEMIKGYISGDTKFFNQSIISNKFKEI